MPLTTASALGRWNVRLVLTVLAAAVLTASGLVLDADRADAQAGFSVQLSRTLNILGNSADSSLALRLGVDRPLRLEVDVDEDGTADFAFNRNRFDRIVVNAGGGDDTVRIDEANGTFTDTEITRINGGRGNDTLLGGSFTERLLGGGGDDLVDGNRGDDVALLGVGDDTFQWDPGDGSDVVEGQEGADRLLFNGAGVAENVDVSANGARLRFFRDVASITMDTDDVETVDFRALGGADTVTVNDLTGTDVTSVLVDLAGVAGGATGDGALDQVTVHATDGDDSVVVTGSAGAVAVAGLAATVAITHADADVDLLAVNGLAGDDTIDASALAADAIKLAVDGGDGDDGILGGAGVDQLTGGGGDDLVDGNRGDDVALLGVGDDTFQWDPGDGSDVVEGQEGADRLLFNGAGVAENVDVSANGARLRFFRDVASITMDTDDVETVDFRALGGADTVTVNDLTGTDVTSVLVDLAGVAGGATGDGALDQVTVTRPMVTTVSW